MSDETRDFSSRRSTRNASFSGPEAAVSDQPVVDQPTVDQPDRQPVADEQTFAPSSEDVTTGEPVTEEPVSEEQAAEDPAPEDPEPVKNPEPTDDPLFGEGGEFELDPETGLRRRVP